MSGSHPVMPEGHVGKFGGRGANGVERGAINRVAGGRAEISIVSLLGAFSDRQACVLACVLLTGFALLVPGLVAPLWIDDVLRTFSTHVPSETWLSWVMRDAHNPLYNLFMRGWIHVFGDSEVSIRLPTALCALASAALLALWAAHRFSPWAGVSASALFILNPAVLLHATIAKNNLLTVFLGVLALAACDLSRDARGRGWMTVALVTSILGLYTDFAFAYAIVPIWLALLIEGLAARDRRQIRRLVVLVAIPLGSALPLLLFKAGASEHLERTYLRHMDLRETWRLLANWMLWGNALLPEPGDRDRIALLGTALAAPLGIAGGVRLLRSSAGRIVLVMLALPIFATLAISAIIHATSPGEGKYIYQERNLLVVLAAYLVVLAVGGVSMRPRWLGRGLLACLIAANLTGAVLQWTLYAEDRTTYWPRRDFRAMAREIERRLDGARTLIVTVPPGGPTRYYLRDHPEVVLRRQGKYPTRFVDVRRFAVEEGVDRLYLLVLRDESDERKVRLDMIAQRWATRRVVSTGGIDLYEVRRPKGAAGERAGMEGGEEGASVESESPGAAGQGQGGGGARDPGGE